MFTLGNPSRNFDFYKKNTHVTIPNTKLKVDTICYLLTKGNDIAMEMGEYLGLKKKSIGYTITFLFFLKETKEKDSSIKKIVSKYQNDRKYLVKNFNKFSSKNCENIDNCTLLCCLLNFKLKINLTRYEFEPIFLGPIIKEFSDRDFILKHEPNKFYYSSNLKEFNEILKLNPKTIYKFYNSTLYTNMGSYQYSTMILSSPYHYYNMYIKNNYTGTINIMSNMNLSNCNLFSELYNIDLSNVNTNHLSKNQKKYCKEKFKFDFEFIENKKYDKKYSKLYDNYYKYNYLCNYISSNFYYEDNTLFLENNTLSNITCYCDGNDNMQKLENMINKHHNSKKGELFIYDYDDTLSTDRYILESNGIELEKLDCRHIENEDKIFNTYVLFDVDNLSKASQKNKCIILTKRFSEYIEDIKIFIEKFKINAHIIATKDYEELNLYTKSDIIKYLWNNIPRILDWNQKTKINSIYFADDMVENFEGFEDLGIDNNIEIYLYHVNLPDEYFQKYIDFLYSGKN